MVNTEIQLLLSQHRFIRGRLLQLLQEIEDSGRAEEAIHFRIKMGSTERAHIGWQMLHCAATLDRYIHFRILQGEPKDKDLVKNYGFGSKPDSTIRTSPIEIRTKLQETTDSYYKYFEGLIVESLDVLPHSQSEKTYKDILILLNWHEAEHMGQCQITWNTFRGL